MVSPIKSDSKASNLWRRIWLSVHIFWSLVRKSIGPNPPKKSHEFWFILIFELIFTKNCKFDIFSQSLTRNLKIFGRRLDWIKKSGNWTSGSEFWKSDGPWSCCWQWFIPRFKLFLLRNCRFKFFQHGSFRKFLNCKGMLRKRQMFRSSRGNLNSRIRLGRFSFDSLRYSNSFFSKITALTSFVQCLNRTCYKSSEGINWTTNAFNSWIRLLIIRKITKVLFVLISFILEVSFFSYYRLYLRHFSFYWKFCTSRGRFDWKIMYIDHYYWILIIRRDQNVQLILIHPEIQTFLLLGSRQQFFHQCINPDPCTCGRVFIHKLSMLLFVMEF